MDFGGPVFVLAVIAMSMGGWIFTTWIRAKNGYPVENEWGGMTHKADNIEGERKIVLLSNENEKLTGQIGRLEERIAVLERIATDTPSRLSAEIDNLR